MKNVLITGTTSGIGRAFAEKFACMGNNIILVSRDKQKLEQQKLFLQNQYHVTVFFIAYDLTKEDAVDFIMKKIYNWNISVDFLVNNAGFNECGLFSETDINKEIKMIDLHIRFITQLTKRILPIMEKNNSGHILNIGSTGSFIPSPFDAVYSATKAYIMSFSNALYGEYANTGIKVTLLCPGATKTEFAQKANMEHTLLFRFAVMKPDKVVKIAYPKMIKGKRLVIPGLYNKLLVFFSKVMPIRITNKLTLIMMTGR
ncbi:MAG: SDR family oxidoreductase [Lachnospiraceae bacterium]|nr:SDR family oxidoreductase [Lachnospiraceae bacterium]